MKKIKNSYAVTGTENQTIQTLLKGFDDRFEKLVEEINKNTKKGDRILDIGCGEGKIWQLFPERKITGLDNSEDNLNKAKKYLKPVLGNAQKLPFKNAEFNFVLASEILEHVMEPDRVLKEIDRVLRPGGTAVISFPNTGSLHFRLGILIWGRNPGLNYPDNKIHIRFFDISDIKKILSQTGLQIIKIRGGNFLSFHQVNFGIYIPVPRIIRYVGGDILPHLALGCIVTMKKVTIHTSNTIIP